MVEEYLQLQAYVDRLELLITICIVLFVIGVIGVVCLIFGFKEER